MRRGLLLFAMLALTACATSERPEGIVERWLISLNQGAAGDPGAYADEELSQALLPDWSELEPGTLDVIEVGRAREGPGGAVLVPFQVQYADDGAVGVARGFAEVERVQGSLRVVRVQAPPDTGPGVDPDFALGAGSSASTLAWSAAVAVAGFLILLTIGLMRLAPEPPPQTGSST